MNGQWLERWLLPLVIVLSLALGGGMAFALSLYHATSESASGS